MYLKCTQINDEDFKCEKIVSDNLQLSGESDVVCKRNPRECEYYQLVECGTDGMSVSLFRCAESNELTEDKNGTKCTKEYYNSDKNLCEVH